MQRSNTATKAAPKPVVGDMSIFDSELEGDELVALWEQEYDRVVDGKYKKNSRNFKPITTNPPQVYTKLDKLPIYVIPRERGGPSYKSVPLMYGGKLVDKDYVAYCPVSKGYPQQDVSSFTLGPVVGRGLCVVNAAFACIICPFHLCGGKFDMKRKGYWKPSKVATRKIRVLEEFVTRTVSDTDSELEIVSGVLEVDGVRYGMVEWLEENRDVWYGEWEKWHRAVGVCSIGSFHWDRDEVPIAFYDAINNNSSIQYVSDANRYLGFVDWKKRCYIQPAYELMETNRVFDYLRGLRERGWILGLVHPKGRSGDAEKPITVDYVRELYDSKYEMSCMPYVVVGKLLGVAVYV